jgi:hypothetical protein
MAKKKQKAGAKAAAPLIPDFKEALNYAGTRPPDNAARKLKKNYSQRLSNAIAALLADKLRATGHFRTILPLPDGSGQETGSASGSTKKLKKTDVRYATPHTGLELLVSIKTLNFRDAEKNDDTGEVTLGRYTKNMVRNDHELRAEAMDHHDRFPYAVLIAVFFIPIDSCDDGTSSKSSFAHAVMTFRPRSGRADATGPVAKFERLFIGLYDAHDPTGHHVGFFDVLTPPPKRGRPPWPNEEPDPTRGGRLLTLDQVIAEIAREYGIRNRTYIRWADEQPADETPPDLEAIENEHADDDDE